MLDRRQIATLHIEKAKAKLSEERYREILFEVAGVSSSKDESLGDAEFRAIVKAIQGEAEKRAGWKDGQLSKFRQYARFCQLNETESRRELFKITGQMHEESEGLDQDHFELVMASLEEKLEKLIEGGLATPDGIDILYWRTRQPNGKLTSRQRHEIFTLWDELQPYLDQEKRRYAYLHGIVQSCLRLKKELSDIGELSRRQGVVIVDALKKRVAQAAAKVQEAVPF